MTANPYEPSDFVSTERSDSRLKSHRLWIAIILHLLVVGVSIVVSRIDAGMLDLPAPIESFTYSMMYPCVFGMYLCPAFVLYSAFRSSLSRLHRILVIGVDVCISVAHFFALLPLVQ